MADRIVDQRVQDAVLGGGEDIRRELIDETHLISYFEHGFFVLFLNAILDGGQEMPRKQTEEEKRWEVIEVEVHRWEIDCFKR